MTLTAGTRLGPYEILGPLGAGGMGEVYRARDTRLDRSVAVKVLPPELAETPELRARFEREARTASALNHPHICVVHDFGRQNGTDYLVMELLEGETLSARLARGPLPPAEALRVAVEIADALDRAHRSGVVHRDLKPSNIMLTRSGAKLMDFGLARSAGLAPATHELSQSPTVTRPLTTEGTIVGTFQYMAPEQLEGREADARTDLFAFGAVLYEMVTGRKAFEGRSQASLISAIMSSEPPPISSLAPLSPPALDAVVRQCLAKDPDERLQTAHDLKLQLQWIREAGSQAGVPATVAARRAGRERLAWTIAAVAAAVAVVALGALTLARLGARRSPGEPVRFTIAAPAGHTVSEDPANMALSPDGRTLAFVAADTGGTARLWVRPLSSLAPRMLEGTDGAMLPFWSPDSRMLGFFADGKLKKVPLEGGGPEVICPAPDGRGGTWNRAGDILFAPQAAGPIARVSQDGGDPEILLRPDSTRHENGLRFPTFLPDGKHFLFASLPGSVAGFEIEVGVLGSTRRTRLLTADGMPATAPGWLIFGRRGRLLAQRCDGSARTRGEPQPIGKEPLFSTYAGAPLVSASRGGGLAMNDAARPNTELRWFDRAYRPVGRVALPAGRYETLALSPDGRRLAATRRSSPMDVDVWIVDLERSLPTRLTFLSTSEIAGLHWSPDGSRLAFNSDHEGMPDLYVKTVDGPGEPQRLLPKGPMFRNLDQWTFDGKYLIYDQPDPATGWDVWAVPVDGEHRAFPVLHSKFNERNGAVSPDGRWIACTSDESGRPELYVQSFPDGGRKVQISSGGAQLALWARNGRELMYAGGGGEVYSVPLLPGPGFRFEPPRLMLRGGDGVGVSATPDLDRFLISVPVTSAAPSVTVMLGWPAALPR